MAAKNKNKSKAKAPVRAIPSRARPRRANARFIFCELLGWFWILEAASVDARDATRPPSRVSSSRAPRRSRARTSIARSDHRYRAPPRARVVLPLSSLTPLRHHIFPIPSPQAKTNNKKATKATPRKASSAWTDAETAALTAGVKKHGTGAFDPPPIFPRRPADRRDSTRRRIANGQFKPTS
jgi:hypothetical protein